MMVMMCPADYKKPVITGNGLSPMYVPKPEKPEKPAPRNT
jgi:hypothetical protein